MYNTHIHIFRDIDVPEKFLPLHLVRILSTKVGFAIIGKMLNFLNPFSSTDIFNRYEKFITIGRLSSQEKIFLECAKHYDEDTKFVVLPMDMAYMGAGKVPRQYVNQLIELAALKEKYPEKVLPFVHIDPRRPNSLSRLRKFVEIHKFAGVKIYPPLGYFPYDEELMPIYEYCEKNNIPVISHCSPYNPVHFKGSKKELKKLLSKSKTPIDTDFKSKKELCAHFTNPKNWEYILTKFPKLKVCLAHFGSSYYWDEYLSDDLIEDKLEDPNWFVMIKNMILEYDNLYTDISFTMNDEDYFSLLKNLLTMDKIKDRILFGSDYYMVETKANENRFSLDLRGYLGEALFGLMSKENPDRFFNFK